MLPRVSRTFALCIRLLPPELEYPILVAYLLCRIADTIEDTRDFSGRDKRDLLHHFVRWLEDDEAGGEPLRAAFSRQHNDEELLASRAQQVLREFRRLPDDQQACIRPWVQEMARGMSDFAMRNPSRGEAEFQALRSVEDLERYCFYVAGTVGHMLTELYPTGRNRIAPRTVSQLGERATSFGLGLQLTNIIKDVADDRGRGWSFVPLDLCEAAGFHPRQLHDPAHREPARRVMDQLIDKAARHLADARDYCTILPRSQYRIRLFCLTSMYFAVRTLGRARRDDRLLDPGHKVKITRSEVYRTVAAASVVAPSNTLIRGYFRQLVGRSA
jgi:farnesyl-diphosphate farnesyltransferase